MIRPVNPLAFAYGFTKAAIRAQALKGEPRYEALALMSTDSRGDVDDVYRWPLVVVQVSSATAIAAGSVFGAATRMRVRWSVLDRDAATASDLATDLSEAVYRSVREHVTCDDGEPVSIWSITQPVMVTTQTVTTDYNEFAFTADMVARPRP